MREFRNWDERNKSISDVKKKLSLMFGFHKDIFLSDLFYYLNSSNYDERRSILSGTNIDFCDIRKVIDFTIDLNKNLNLDDYYLYMGSCEMFHYFFMYDETDDDELERFLAVDHETGVIEHVTESLGLWFQMSEEEEFDILRESI